MDPSPQVTPHLDGFSISHLGVQVAVFRTADRARAGLRVAREALAMLDEVFAGRPSREGVA